MKSKRIGIVLIIMWLLIIALTFRIFYVSFGNINKKVLATAGTRTTSRVLYNSKGVIYDRNLLLLAGNQKINYLIINPREFDMEKLSYLSNISQVDTVTISEKLKKETPFVVSSFETPDKIDGVVVCEGITRYPEEQVSQHIVGYLDNEAIVGISGVEKAYNEVLSEYGSTVNFTYSSNAVNGIIPQMEIETDENMITENGIVLTIDKELSSIAEKSLEEHCNNGCVIVMNCNNGELLTLSSIPGFDANNISKYTDSNDRELINNSMVNQTVGSVFKMIVAVSALQHKLDGFMFECTGAINVSERVFTCQNNHTHGHQSLDDAFANSCNCYFIALGQLLGYDKIIQTAKLFGLDSSIKIAKDLYSQSGKLPVNNGDVSLANLSIGQGDLLLPPLTVTRMTAAICNGGYLINPTIYSGMYINNKIFNKPEYQYKSNIISNEIAERIKQMCINCVEKGTGKKATPDYDMAGGKTASAQTGIFNDNGKEILNTYFTGFYPADNPEYVITVFAENGISGSSTCAPVFKEICNYIGQNY